MSQTTQNELILITGAARSGTSMTAGIINLCGAFGGEMSGPNVHNQRGMFENVFIRDQITKPYLRRMKCDPRGQKPLPNPRQIFCVGQDEPAQLREKVLKTYKHQGLKDNQPFFLKQAKICLVWYIWHKAFPDSKWVIVRRKKEDIAKSCLRTAFMSSYRDLEGWNKWVEVHEMRFNQMKTAGLQIKEVWPEKIISGDFSEIKDVVNWLDLEWDEKIVRSFVEPALWKARRK